MTSRDLLHVSLRAEKDSRPLQHAENPAPGRRCQGRCWKCFLEAKAAVYERASDAARALEER